MDFAIVNGLLKRAPGKGLVHAPFALTPAPITPRDNHRIEELTAPFNRLVLALSRDIGFLGEVLAGVAESDGFTRDLLAMAAAREALQPLRLFLTRGDYFLQAGGAGEPPLIRQVELNTISAGYAGLAGRVNLLHRQLFAGTPQAEELIHNDPIGPISRGVSRAFGHYGHPEGCLLMIVQPGDGNIFDQRMLEIALREEGIEVERMTLEELAERGRLREGHLTVGGRIAAIVYFRAAYTPDDFTSPDTFRARGMIENSSAVSIPDIATQLAGTKKIQQLLAEAGTLEKFCLPPDAALLRSTFAGIYSMEEPIQGPEGSLPAWRAAMARPGEFVMKPQREGGGNNLFDDELRAALAGSSAEERRPFILMERIAPVTHTALLVKEGVAEETLCVSEIGRFGLLLAHGGEELLNVDAGYLVRTKPRELREGGITAGYGFLNNLCTASAQP